MAGLGRSGGRTGDATRLAGLGAALLVGPGVLLLWARDAGGVLVALGVGALTAVVLGRIAHLAREREDARRALQARETELRERAERDWLTGLTNRSAFTEALEAALASPGGPSPLAVLFVDLDGFKAVNDTLGHAGGDALLVAVAERLRGAVRDRPPSGDDGDGGGDVVARLGGDEFAVLLADGGSGRARAVADRVVTRLRGPYQVEGRSAVVTASVGVALAEGADGPDDLLRRSDDAMYAAKARGRDAWVAAPAASRTGTA